MALIVSSIRPSEPPPRWSWKAIKKYVLFSAIFTLNIWLSNYSLLIATIGVHQIVRTTIPLFTMWFSWLFFHEKYSLRLLPSVLLVIVGVLLTVWSDRLEVELFGIAVVVAGCVFSSLKGIMTRNIQLNMDTIQVFKVICPISVLMLTVASICIGELSRASQTYEHRQNMDLVIQGVLAAALNYVSFKCASLNSPLTMNIAGNVKQMVTPLMAHLLISSPLTKGGSIGILATLLGALWYTVLINRAKQPLITPTATHAELAETESKTAQNSEEQMV